MFASIGFSPPVLLRRFLDGESISIPSSGVVDSAFFIRFVLLLLELIGCFDFFLLEDEHISSPMLSYMRFGTLPLVLCLDGVAGVVVPLVLAVAPTFFKRLVVTIVLLCLILKVTVIEESGSGGNVSGNVLIHNILATTTKQD